MMTVLKCGMGGQPSACVSLSTTTLTWNETAEGWMKPRSTAADSPVALLCSRPAKRRSSNRPMDCGWLVD